MKKLFCCLTCLLLTFAVTACSGQNSSEPKKEEAAAKEAPAGQATAPVKPEAGVPAGEKAALREMRGKVAETMNVSSYTYILLDEGAGKETWVAVPKADLKVGDEVVIPGSDMMLTNFKSKSLDRTFDKIFFATGVFTPDGKVLSGTAGGSGGSAMQMQSAAGGSGATAMLNMTAPSGGSAANVVDFDGLKVEKAAGPDAYTIGEIFEKAASLNGKHVVVRGKVVKFSENIMNKNWIHIQDGTGDPAKKTSDLVVTTTDTVKTGDIVTIEGTTAAPKDFGFGYKYDVIVEDAKVSSAEGAKA